MNNNNKQRPIILPIILMTSLMFILLFSGWKLASNGFDDIAPIENVEIEGSYENVSLNDLRDKVIGVLEGGYFTVNIDTIRSALLELPWVEDASVRRQWPPSIHIRVIEKQAVAYWGKTDLLSDQGEIFTPTNIVRTKKLPQLDGPEGLHKKVWSFMADIGSAFSEMNFEIKQLKLDERRAWTLHLAAKAADEVIIKLGRQDTANRLDRFVRVFSNNEAIDLTNIAVIDMRYPNGFAMRSRKTELAREV